MRGEAPGPATSEARSAHRVRSLLAGWRGALRALADDVDHDAVRSRIADGGALSGGYLLMTSLAAAIATLGLLLSSPAVIIGAMLLSPLMGPIVLLGFSFWTLDLGAMRRALVSLTLGFGLAFVVALLLTLASPLKESTTEILARSRPTLFDLLVAVFSGVAGGYAVIRGRAEAVIGVAIATALMPPVAVVGFGVGVGQWNIALGALLLFATNLVAIAIAAAAVAAAFGFRPHLHRHGWISRVAVALVLIALCVPLTLSLQTIALESRATASARAEIRRLFGPKARISSLSVRSDGGQLEVDTLVATPKAIPDASTLMSKALGGLDPRGVEVVLDQLVLADPSRITPGAQPVTHAVVASSSTGGTEQALRRAIPFPVKSIDLDEEKGDALIVLPADSVLTLDGAMALEDGLRRRRDLPRASVIPPVRALPPLPLAGSNTGVTLAGDIKIQAWALDRWGAATVLATACPASSLGASNEAIAATVREALPSHSVVYSQASPTACRRSATKPPFVMLSPQ